MEFKEIKKLYNSKYELCGNLGTVYNKGTNRLSDINCNHWLCKNCFTRMRYILYLEIIKNVYCFDLQKHFVITVGGKEFREKYSIEDSYRYMSVKWNSFLVSLKRDYGKIIYILLPRAQKDGYCHYHIITNKYMSWKDLNDKRKKYGLGYMSIQKNKDVAEYLNKDYFDNNEWYIPPRYKHYRSSREIKLFNFSKTDYNNIYFKNTVSIEQIKKYLKKLYRIEYDDSEYFLNKLMKNKKIIYLNQIENVKKEQYV